MRMTCLGLALPLLFAPASFAADTNRSEPAEPQPEIVRLSYVQGDVRIARGPAAAKAAGSVWEQAATDIPVESGYSLVTGSGHTEIEFEDDSTAYLGENSVLTFADLTTTGGIPSTVLTLLSGTLTLHLHNRYTGERYFIETPNGVVNFNRPGEINTRVVSYADAMAMTPLPPIGISQYDPLTFTAEPTALTLSDLRGIDQALARHPYYFRNGKPITTQVSEDNNSVEWDDWVAERITSRQAEEADLQQAAGLAHPIAGLAELRNAGSFFACPPYGTCWAPTGGWGPQATSSGQQRPLSTFDDFFPCFPGSFSSLYQIDPVSGTRRILATNGTRMNPSYLWAVCHAGEWIHHNGRYA